MLLTYYLMKISMPRTIKMIRMTIAGVLIGAGIAIHAHASAVVPIANRLAGKILLQVERNGEAWYVHPTHHTRYYFGRPRDALTIMRQQGLGISNRDLFRLFGIPPSSPPAPVYITKSVVLAQRLAGRILLQVEAHGEAYYINPKDLRGYYLGSPADALRVMQTLGEGIRDNDLAQIPVAIPGTSGFTAPHSVLPPLTTPPSIISVTTPSGSSDIKITDFLLWSNAHGIEIVGIHKTTDHFYYQGGKPEDFSDPKDVPNLLEVADGLYQIPENIIAVLKGKTLYVSHLNGRGYAVLGSWPEQNILAGMNRGVILEQQLKKENVVHEIGHILDYHGIRGMYEDPQNLFANLEPLRKEIFSVSFPYDPALVAPPVGYLNVYSTANDAENFAEHFASYVFRAQDFRVRAKRDEILQRKYDFFKNNLFGGREYAL